MRDQQKAAKAADLSKPANDDMGAHTMKSEFDLDFVGGASVIGKNFRMVPDFLPNVVTISRSKEFQWMIMTRIIAVLQEPRNSPDSCLAAYHEARGLSDMLRKDAFPTKPEETNEQRLDKKVSERFQ